MSLNDIVFEIERRVIIFHKNTTMPDSTLLGYVGDPNNIINGNTPGETLLYNCPSGTRYLDKTNDPNTPWEKVGNPPGGIWVIKDPSQYVAGDNVIIEPFTLTATDIQNKYITISENPKEDDIKLEVKGAPTQIYGVDFKRNISFLRRIEWASLDLENILQEGDRIIITYIKS